MKLFDLKLLYQLINYVAPYKLIFFTTIFISICFGVISTLRPLLIQYAFDNYIMHKDSLGLLTIMLIILLLLFLEAFLQYQFIYKSNYLSQKIIQDLRLEVFSKLLKFKTAL